MKITDLTHVGLTEKEAKIYLATLELGYASVQGIARKAKTNRVAVYSVLEHLKVKGLIDTTYMGKRKVYVASKPAKLLNILREKQGEVKNELRSYEENVLPELMSLYNKAEGKPHIRYYGLVEGLEIFDSNIEKSNDKYIYGINSWDTHPEKFRATRTHLSKIRRSGKHYKNICLYSRKSMQEADRMKLFPEATFVHKKMEAAELGAAIFANDNKVYIIHYTENPCVLIIENKNTYNAIKILSEAASGFYKKSSK